MASLSDYAAKVLQPATATPPAAPALSDYAGGKVAVGKDASTNYKNDFATFDAKDAVSSFLQKVPIENGAPVTPEAKTQSFVQKYSDFSQKLAGLSSEFDVGAIKGVGGVVGGAAAIGNWLLAPLGKAIDAATGVHDKAEAPNAGDMLTAFGDTLEQHTGVKDKGYLDDVFEGLGTALPYIAGGTIAGAAKVPALISSLGIGGLQALSTARDDYHEMVKNGDQNAGLKAAGVFGIDLALNTVAHFLGPLAQGGKSGIVGSLGRVLKSTLLETGNFGIGQTIVNNVATGRAPLEGVLDSALVMLPISAAFGAAGEVTNSTHIKAQEKQVADIVHGIADAGLNQGHAADALSQLTGIPRSQVEAKVTEIVGKDADLQAKFDKNIKSDLPDMDTVASTVAETQETTPEPIPSTDEIAAVPEPDVIAGLHSDLQTAYKEAGNGPLVDEKLPEAPVNPGEDNGFGQKEPTLEEHQAQLDEINSRPKAGHALKTVMTELELSEPGYRGTKDDTGEGYGVSSTFPQWIPEDLRSKELFGKVFGGLDINNLKYPDGNRPRLRRLYDLLLDEVDRRAGIDTSKIRGGILEAYESGTKKEAAGSDNRGAQGGKGGSEKSGTKEEVTRSKYADAAKEADHEDAFLSTLKKNDAFNEEHKDKIAAGEMEAKPGLKEFAKMAREKNARGASLRLASGRKDIGEWAKAIDKELTPEERDAQTAARSDLAAGKDVSDETQALLDSAKGKFDKFLAGARRLSLRMEREAEKNGEPFNIKENDAKVILDKLFKPGEVDFLFHTDGYLKDEATAGREALGMYTPGYALENPLIKMVMNDGKVQSKTLYEEAFHAYLDNFLTTSEKADLFDRTSKHLLTLPGRASLKLDGYRSDEVAEEWLAHDFADYASEKAHFEGNRSFYASVVSKVRAWVRKLVGAQRVYDNFLEGKRPAPRKLTVTRRMDDMLSVRKAEPPEKFKNFEDLSTRLLGKLEGRKVLSKQFISDLTNAADLKQPERDLIREVLKTEGAQVNVADFADRVKAQLLPLTTDLSPTSKALGAGQPRYESFTLNISERGSIADYREKVYQSPINTKGGSHHFNTQDYPGYFAHSRTEDLARKPSESFNRSDLNTPEKVRDMSNGVRRIVEIQSDLFQKGKLEKETAYLPELTQRERTTLRNKYPDTMKESDYTALNKEISELQEQKRIAKDKALTPFRNTWHERIIREEVKAAAVDGKTMLQFPTGETAMKIERLGSVNNFTYAHEENRALIESGLKVGLEVENSMGKWLITDVLGDGKFSAISKREADMFEKDTGKSIKEALTDPEGDVNDYPFNVETFDISGKMNTDNPIYKFYEKEVGRYLKNNYDAERVTDAQGVTWNQVEVKPEEATKPVSAFHLRKSSDEMSDEDAALEYYRSQKAIEKTEDSTPVSRETAKNKPVGAGKERQSKAFERVKERLGEEVGADYNQLNLAKDTADAIEFVESNPDAARRISEGLDLPPAGMTETAISIAYGEKMADQGNFQAAADAERARSLRQTRRGQEIAAEKGRFNDNSAPTFIRRVMQARLEDIGKAKLRYIDGLKGKTPRQAATKVIEDQAAELKQRLVERQLKIRDAQSLLDRLTCV